MRKILAGYLVAMCCVLGAASTARATDVTLYEVSEAVKLDASKGGKFRRSEGTLTGWAEAGTVLCPQFIVDALDQTTATTKVCGLSVDATGRADDVTGIGPVSGTVTVMIQDKNELDAPEILVISGKMTGIMDMSPAFQNGQPLGSITGTFSVHGVNGTIAKGYKAAGNFSGTFRIPFALEGVPQYLTDAGPVAIASSEYVLSYPAVRLEVTLTPATLTSSSDRDR